MTVLLEAIIITLLGVLTTIAIKTVRDLAKKCAEIAERETILETKLDIYLDNAGFDVHKVNRVIKEHIEELKQNNKPSVGCINTKELYKKTEEPTDGH